MPPHPDRIIPVAGITNLRDLGGYATTAGHVTRWRRLLRGDSPHVLDDQGRELLRSTGLRSVVDLRSPQELEHEPNPLAELDTVAFHSRPVFDDLAPTMEGIKARNSDDLLLDFYLAALEGNSTAIRDAMQVIATAPDGPVLFHCTAGKDRTGIIAALLLGVAGVERADIIADYTLTGERIAPLVARLLERTRANGGDTATHARFLRCDPATMVATLDHIDTAHGSVAGYLADIGLTAGDIGALRDRLLGD